MNRRLRVPTLAAAVTALTLLPSTQGGAIADSWSLPENVPGSRGGYAVLADVDSDGTVTAAWEVGGSSGAPFLRAVTSRRASDGTWSSAAPVINSTSAPVALDVGRDDVANLLMRVPQGTVLTRMAPGGTWSEPELVPGTESVRGIRLDASGPSPVVAWHARADETRRVFAAVRNPNGTWDGPTAVSAPGRLAKAPDVGVAADGAATVIWRQDDRARGQIWSRVRNPDGTWEPRQAMSSLRAGMPDLSVAPGGTAAIGWPQRREADRLVQPRVAHRNQAGVWSTDAVDEWDNAVHEVTVLARGGTQAFAKWSVGSRVWAAARNAGGWRPGERLFYTGFDAQFAVSPASSGRKVFLFWSANLTNSGSGNDYLVMGTSWTGDVWQTASALTSSHHTAGDFDVALNRDARGCLLVGVHGGTAYSLQASCMSPSA
jgi:hypothetical protein